MVSLSLLLAGYSRVFKAGVWRQFFDVLVSGRQPIDEKMGSSQKGPGQKGPRVLNGRVCAECFCEESALGKACLVW